jgi:hypothetical protein
VLWPGGWRVAEPSDPVEQTHDVEVQLALDGNDVDGYHLVMTPDGALTADDWYPTLHEAMAVANARFGVPSDAWTPN